jgi:hypothetical protein
MRSSKHEPSIAQILLDDHPIGTLITGDCLLSWIEHKAAGHAITAALAITDRREKLSVIRCYLNKEAHTPYVAEDRRYVIVVVKHEVFAVVGHANYVSEQAASALARPAKGAMTPINSPLKHLDAIKLDELSPITRHDIENKRQEIETFRAVMVKATHARSPRDRIGMRTSQ